MSLFSKFPSYQHIVQSAVKALRRFPIAMAVAAVGVMSAIASLEAGDPEYRQVFERLLLTCMVGLPMLVAASAIGLKSKSGGTSIAAQLISLAALVAYFFLLPTDVVDHEPSMYRFLLLLVAAHALVAFLPWLSRSQVNGFWQYNKSLFLRILISVLYSGVLFVGLAIALASGDQLFGINVPDERYPQLWFIVAGIINTWIFLAGFPDDLDSLEQRADYPGGLKIFTQFILLPLVGLYFLILITYEIKIIATWNWPRGWVSELILWFAVVGIFSLLLLWPLRNRTENKWIKNFAKWYFRGLVPLLVMLFLAISVRISEYGVTEERYFVLAMAIGLTVVTVYFLFSRRQDIRIVPIVLSVIAILSAFGPWSAFLVSKASQQARLEEFLAKYEMLEENELRRPAHEIPVEDRQEMSSILRYLGTTHGPEAFSPWLSDNHVEDLSETSEWAIADSVAQILGFAYTVAPRRSGSNLLTVVSDLSGSSTSIEEFTHLVTFQGIGQHENERDITIGESTLSLAYDDSTQSLQAVLSMPGRPDSPPIEFALQELFERHASNYSVRVPVDSLTLTGSNEIFRIKLIVEEIYGYYGVDSTGVSSMSGLVLFSLTRSSE